MRGLPRICALLLSIGVNLVLFAWMFRGEEFEASTAPRPTPPIRLTPLLFPEPDPKERREDPAPETRRTPTPDPDPGESRPSDPEPPRIEVHTRLAPLPLPDLPEAISPSPATAAVERNDPTEGEGGSPTELSATEGIGPVPSSEPILLSRAKAVFPLEARRGGLEGEVRLRLLVGTDGRVERVEVTGWSGTRAFVVAGRQAARRYRFRPATRNGEPVERWCDQTILFQLEDR